jgi:hypothetical protein
MPVRDVYLRDMQSPDPCPLAVNKHWLADPRDYRRADWA